MIYVAREYYEPELIAMERFLRPGGVAVDAGACLGIYTCVAGRLVGDSGLVLAFEPVLDSFSVLVRNLAINRLANVVAFRKALANWEGRTCLYRHDGRADSFSLGLAEGVECQEVSVTTLDRVAASEGIDRVDLIKMDVEGAEELVLRGATSLLLRGRPVVVMEINPRAATRLGLRADGAWILLKDMGYDFFLATGAGELREVDRPPPAGNVVAIPRKGA